MPIVSVVIPVYNSEKYINKCLDSLLEQTLSDIEIICVNDGSKDRSLEILNQYAEADSRIRVVTQANQGAGPARNKGIELASGKYLSILDADDFFAPDMLEKTVNKAEEDKAEITIFEAWNYDDVTQELTENDVVSYKEYLPKCGCFSRKDIPQYILNFTWGCVWNKLFLRGFVEKNNLKFQDVRMVDDAYFVLLALVKARKINFLEEKLLFYRVNNPLSQLGQTNKTPDTFFDAYHALQTTLINEGMFEEVEQSLVNRTLKMCIIRLEALSSFGAYKYLYNQLRTNYFKAFGFGKYDIDFFYKEGYFKKYKAIEKYEFDEYMWVRYYRMNKYIYGNYQQLYFRFPFEKIDKGSRIVLYGAGAVGNAYYRQVVCSQHCFVALWVDQKYETIGAPVSSPELLNTVEFDNIVICVVDDGVEKVIRKYLITKGIKEDKIIWENPIFEIEEEDI